MIRLMAFLSMFAALTVILGCEQKEQDETSQSTGQQTVTEAVTDSFDENTCAPNSGIDCNCIQTLIKNSESDDGETDMTAIIDDTNGELPQHSIDIIIDTALEADDACVSE